MSDLQMMLVSEVASALQISRSKAYAMMAQGQIPSVRIGSARRVPRAKFEAWIAELVDSA